MNKVIQLAVFWKSLATGIMAPVLSLVLLAYGASISSISLLIGVYSLTVIVAEFPSGIVADLYGRKRAFLLSAICYVACYVLIYFANSITGLALAMAANGLGRAFSSGSIDALAVDEANAQGYPIEKVTARLSILESAGLAAGALAGGFLTSLNSRYAGNLFANIFLYVVLFIMVGVWVKENSSPAPAQSAAKGRGLRRVGVQMKESFGFVAQKGAVRMLFVLTALTGFVLLGVETYWQPALQAMQPPEWLFGAVSFASFGSIMLSSKLAERWLARNPERGMTLLLALKAALGIAVAVLVLQGARIGFVGVYLLVYFILGGGGVAENTLLHRLAPAKQRASILSLFSFVMQLGGLLASLCGYVISLKGEYQLLWLVAGGALLLCAAGMALRLYKENRAEADGRTKPF